MNQKERPRNQARPKARVCTSVWKLAAVLQKQPSMTGRWRVKAA